jgi:chemotaxis protein MotB
VAKGGGGSWKVAYADFVTAMMAFFLVMWIGSQDQKTRQSVANYFVDPSGSAKKPVETGAVMDATRYGNTPSQGGAQMNMGRQSYDNPNEPSPTTKAVALWIREDAKRFKYWREQAQRCRAGAESRSKLTPEEVASQELTKQLDVEIRGDVESNVKEGVYRDLVFGSLKDVNWKQIADDLLRE